MCFLLMNPEPYLRGWPIIALAIRGKPSSHPVRGWPSGEGAGLKIL